MSHQELLQTTHDQFQQICSLEAENSNLHSQALSYRFQSPNVLDHAMKFKDGGKLIDMDEVRKSYWLEIEKSIKENVS